MSYASLAGKKIGLDPGHGAGVNQGVYIAEGDWVLDAGLRARAILQNSGGSVVMTRTDGTNVDINTRIDILNSNNVHLAVSIHSNAAGATAHGIETYYCSLSPYTANGKNLAARLLDRALEMVRNDSRGVKECLDSGRGIHYGIIRYTNMPAALPEYYFHTNDWENYNLHYLEQGRDKIARSLCSAVTDYFGGGTAPQDQSLIRAAGDVSVYWFQNGKRYHVTFDAMTAMNDDAGDPRWKWEAVGEFPADVVNQYPEGPEYISISNASNGILIRETDKVCVMHNGKHRWITSIEARDWRGTDWSRDVIVVPSAILGEAVFVGSEGNPIYAIGEGEADEAIKSEFVGAYTRSEDLSVKGWPGSVFLELGFPTTKVGEAYASGCSGIAGKYQKFDEDGVLEWSEHGAFEVHGAIGKAYQEAGYSASRLGFPLTDEYPWGANRRSDFEGGYIYWEPEPVNATHIVYSDTVQITSGPSGSPNPVPSGGKVNCTVTGTDSLGHTLSYQWSCPAGSFENANSRTPIWTAPPNNTGSTQYYTISVTVSCTGGKSAPGSYQQGVSSGVPRITRIDPAIPPVDPNPRLVKVYGAGFVSGSEVIYGFGNTWYPALPLARKVYQSSGLIDTSPKLAWAGTWKVKVRNPDGTESNVFEFCVGLAVTRIDPAVPPVDPNPRLAKVYGAGFVSQSQVIYGFGQVWYPPIPADRMGPTSSSTHLDTNPKLCRPGTWKVKVRNPNGTESNVFEFRVGLAVTRIDPAVPPVDPNPRLVKVYGAGFVSQSRVIYGFGEVWYPPIPADRMGPTFSSTHLDTNPKLCRPGTWKVKVRNPDGAESNVFEFTVQAARTSYSLYSIEPTLTTSIDPETGDFVLSWEGVGMQPCLVEVSEDLESWYQTSGVIMPLADGPVSWRDLDSAVFRQRFYRLLLLTD
ncbi:MAG: N-acetylmuramoyl-L-alanine amidase [bacterium]|nr:N-acetylmuramoyl-L-alanine amidase [bacterium]